MLFMPVKSYPPPPPAKEAYLNWGMALGFVQNYANKYLTIFSAFSINYKKIKHTLLTYSYDQEVDVCDRERILEKNRKSAF